MRGTFRWKGCNEIAKNTVSPWKTFLFGRFRACITCVDAHLVMLYQLVCRDSKVSAAVQRYERNTGKFFRQKLWNRAKAHEEMRIGTHSSQQTCFFLDREISTKSGPNLDTIWTGFLKTGAEIPGKMLCSRTRELFLASASSEKFKFRLFCNCVRTREGGTSGLS